MDNVIAIGVGLALRAVIDILTDSDYRLTGTLIGLWEGFVLSHFLHKNPRNPNDAYLALATRFAIDFLLTNSLVRFALTGAWTLVGLLLADVAPSVWRETGLRHVYRALRKDVKAMMRSMPRWRIENDIQVPNITISNPVPGFLSRTPASSIVSSTRAAPPASPAPILQRRSTSGSPSSQVTPSVTNTLTREVLLGPSPALIHIDVDPDFPPSFNPDSPSHRPSLLSNSSDSDPSRHDPIPIPDDDRVHTAVPSHMQEQEQEQGPDLSVLDFTPPVAAFEITATSEIISPTPRAHMRTLPPIPDSEFDLSVHAPPVLPLESRPASRVRNLISTFSAGIWSQNTRTGVGEVDPDRGSDPGKVRAPPHQRAGSAGVLGQAQNQPTSSTQPNSTGHQASSKWEHSRLRHPEQIILSDGAAGIGGFAIRAGGQMPQRSGTPQAHSGSDGVRTSSALGLSTPLSLSQTPATLPNPTPATLPNPAPASAPQTKPPTPAPLRSKQTTPTLQPNLESSKAEPLSTTPAPALPSKTPTPAPLSRNHTPMPPSKTSTPRPKSRCTSPGLTSTSVRNPTDYDPANPIRPMPGLKSPSTEPDPIFPGAGACDGSATGEFNLLDTSCVDVDDDPPPPFKEFESPVHPRAANFGVGVDDRKGPGEQVAKGSRGEGAKGGAEEAGLEKVATGEGAIINQNIGDVNDVGGHKADEGTNENTETSQDAGDHTQGTGKNTPERAREKVENSQEQGTSQQDGDGNQGAGEGIQGAGRDNRVTGEDTKFASGDTHVAGGNTEDAGPSLKPEPTPLTQEQSEAETNRIAFLLKQVVRLETSRNKLKSSNVRGLSEIQTRLDLIPERIARANFADTPKDPSPAPEVSTPLGKTQSSVIEELANMIVDLLISRQDAGPIEVNVSFPSRSRQNILGGSLRKYVAENKFSLRSDSAEGQLVFVITV